MGQEDKKDSKEAQDWDGAIPDDEELPAYSEARPAIVNAHPSLQSPGSSSEVAPDKKLRSLVKDIQTLFVETSSALDTHVSGASQKGPKTQAAVLRNLELHCSGTALNRLSLVTSDGVPTHVVVPLPLTVGYTHGFRSTEHIADRANRLLATLKVKGKERADTMMNGSEEDSRWARVPDYSDVETMDAIKRVSGRDPILSSGHFTVKGADRERLWRIIKYGGMAHLPTTAVTYELARDATATNKDAKQESSGKGTRLKYAWDRDTNGFDDRLMRELGSYGTSELWRIHRGPEELPYLDAPTFVYGCDSIGDELKTATTEYAGRGEPVISAGRVKEYSASMPITVSANRCNSFSARPSLRNVFSTDKQSRDEDLSTYHDETLETRRTLSDQGRLPAQLSPQWSRLLYSAGFPSKKAFGRVVATTVLEMDEVDAKKLAGVFKNGGAVRLASCRLVARESAENGKDAARR